MNRQDYEQIWFNTMHRGQRWRLIWIAFFNYKRYWRFWNEIKKGKHVEAAFEDSKKK